MKRIHVAQDWSNEICARKALTEVIGPQPPLLEDLPPRAAATNKASRPVPRFELPQGVPGCMAGASLYESGSEELFRDADCESR